MLKQLRKKKTMKRILWTLIILIIPPFVFWGIGSAMRSRQKGPAYAGTIFGKNVSFEEYSEAWQAVRNLALIMYGPKFNEIYDEAAFDRQTWQRLVLLREARKRKIRVTDSEVTGTIQKFPFLQSKGSFDFEAYNYILRQVLRTEARQFEEQMRSTLAISKLQDSVTRDISITDEEAREEYKKENEKAQISYILISPKAFEKSLRTDEAAVKRYYENNTESFRVGEKVDIEYLGFEFADYENGVKVSDDEIKNYYDKNAGEFDEKKEFKDVKDEVKKKITAGEARNNALADAEKIAYILSEKTKGFDEVAKENSIKIKETGLFGRDQIIPQIGWFPEIQDIAFKLKAGEASDLIKSKGDIAKGCYIIRLKEKRPSYIPKFEEVKPKIEAVLKEEEALRRASKEAGRLHKKIEGLVSKKGLKFQEAALRVKRSPGTSEPFARNGYVKGIGMASELGEAAFKTRPGDVAPLAKTRAGFCVFSVAEVLPIDEEKFTKEKEEFAKKALEAKKVRILNEWYYKLFSSANLKSNITLEGALSPS